MRKLKLDLDMLRVDSFATATSKIDDPFTDPSGGVSDCVSRWVKCEGTVRAAQEPTWILTCPHSCDPRCPDPPTVTPTCACADEAL